MSLQTRITALAIAIGTAMTGLQNRFGVSTDSGNDLTLGADGKPYLDLESANNTGAIANKLGKVVTQNVAAGTNTVVHNLGPDVMVQIQDSDVKTLLIDWQDNGSGTGIQFYSPIALTGVKFTFWKASNSILLEP